MAKNIFLRYSFLVFILFVQACGGDKDSKTPDSNPEHTGAWDLTGNIYKTSGLVNLNKVKTDEDGQWLDVLNKLGIEKTNPQTVVVGAPNTSKKKSVKENVTKMFGKLKKKLAPTTPSEPGATITVEVGQFKICEAPFGYVYLAAGPQASETKSLGNTKELIAKLYYDMLSQAKKDNMKCIVLCPISTGALADKGKESETSKDFTKDEFIANAFEGMKEGITKFQQENPNHELNIILNDWDQEEIGKKTVEQVKELPK